MCVRWIVFFVLVGRILSGVVNLVVVIWEIFLKIVFIWMFGFLLYVMNCCWLWFGYMVVVILLVWEVCCFMMVKCWWSVVWLWWWLIIGLVIWVFLCIWCWKVKRWSVFIILFYLIKLLCCVGCRIILLYLVVICRMWCYLVNLLVFVVCCCWWFCCWWRGFFIKWLFRVVICCWICFVRWC